MKAASNKGIDVHVAAAEFSLSVSEIFRQEMFRMFWRCFNDFLKSLLCSWFVLLFLTRSHLSSIKTASVKVLHLKRTELQILLDAVSAHK